MQHNDELAYFDSQSFPFAMLAMMQPSPVSPDEGLIRTSDSGPDFTILISDAPGAGSLRKSDG